MPEDINTTPQYRLSKPTMAFMLAVAGLYDLVSIIPFANIVIVPLAWIHFWFWFKLHDISIGFTNKKRIATMGVGSVVEAFPAISALPTWLVNILIQILLTRVEDKAGITLPAGGRSLKKKTIRRGAQTIEHNAVALRRLRNIREIRAQRERFQGMDAITPQ